MYKSGNKVGGEIVEIAEHDMNEKLKQPKNKNERCAYLTLYPVLLRVPRVF